MGVLIDCFFSPGTKKSNILTKWSKRNWRKQCGPKLDDDLLRRFGENEMMVKVPSGGVASCPMYGRPVRLWCLIGTRMGSTLTGSTCNDFHVRFGDCQSTTHIHTHKPMDRATMNNRQREQWRKATHCLEQSVEVVLQKTWTVGVVLPTKYTNGTYNTTSMNCPLRHWTCLLHSAVHSSACDDSLCWACTQRT